MKQKKALKYGFSFSCEYVKYKKICNICNESYVYSQWYKDVTSKYGAYSIDKLRDFEKYLIWLIRRRKEYKNAVALLERASSYLISILIPLLALMFAWIPYLDAIQSDLDQLILNDQTNVQMAAEQLQYRLEICSDIFNIYVWVGYIAIFYIVVMLILFLIQKSFEKEKIFLEDYRECISRLLEEKKEK